MNWKDTLIVRYAMAAHPRISLQEADKRKLFGPVYHGTTNENRQNIDANGFEIYEGEARKGQSLNGYENGDYWNGIPAPVHHLGYEPLAEKV